MKYLKRGKHVIIEEKDYNDKLNAKFTIEIPDFGYVTIIKDKLGNPCIKVETSSFENTRIATLSISEKIIACVKIESKF